MYVTGLEISHCTDKAYGEAAYVGVQTEGLCKEVPVCQRQMEVEV
jgi:hypothetical protein